VVFLDKRVKYRSKVFVGIPITSIDATMLVIEWTAQAIAFSRVNPDVLVLMFFS